MVWYLLLTTTQWSSEKTKSDRHNKVLCYAAAPTIWWMSKEISDPKRYHFYSTNKSGLIQGGRDQFILYPIVWLQVLKSRKGISKFSTNNKRLRPCWRAADALLTRRRRWRRPYRRRWLNRKSAEAPFTVKGCGNTLRPRIAPSIPKTWV